MITPRGPKTSLKGTTVRHDQVGRIVLVLRLFLGVQMVEVAEELVEAVVRRQMLVEVAEVVLAELPCRVALFLEKRSDGGVLFLHALRGPRHADLGKPRAEGRLPGDEGGSTGCAGLLGVVVGKDDALIGDPVDVGRLVAHQPHRVGRDVRLPDIVAPDDEDVRFFCCMHSCTKQHSNTKKHRTNE